MTTDASWRTHFGERPTPMVAGTCTVGPWRYVKHRSERQIRGFPPGYGPLVASVEGRVYVGGEHPAQDVEADSNARLIAAAPQLLVAAQEVLAAMSADGGKGASEPLAHLQAAVQLATGG